NPSPPRVFNLPAVIPKSARPSLTANVAAVRPADGTTLSLTAGTPLTLPDQTIVTIPVGTTVVRLDGSTFQIVAPPPQVQLPGSFPLSFSLPIPWQYHRQHSLIPTYT